MDISQVVRQFALLAGLSATDADQWRHLCAAAAARVTSMLRQGVDPEENAHRLCMAAAGEAYYRYTLLQTMGSSSSIKIGDISVSESSSHQVNAAAVQKSMMELISDLVYKEAFVFQQVGE